MKQLMHQKIVWPEGLLLSQQHFQYFSTQLTQERRFFHSINQGHQSHGLLILEIDELALRHDRFQVKHLLAVLENGEWIAYHHDPNTPEKELYIDIDHHDPALQDCLIQIQLYKGQTYHGVPGYPSLALASARWRATEVLVKDEMDASRQENVLVSEFNIQLTTDLSDNPDYTRLPLARLTRVLGSWSVDTKFIPPVLEIGASIALKQRLYDFISALGTLEKRYLEMKQRGEVKSRSLQYVWEKRYRALACLYYDCEQILQKPHLSFASLWDTLLRHCFEWEYEYLNVRPIRLPDWDPRKGDWFPALDALCGRVLELVRYCLPVNIQTISLQWDAVEKVYHAAQLSPAWLVNQQLYLELNASVTDQNLIELGLKAKIAESKILPHRIIRSLKGLDVSLATEKSRVDAGKQYHYFKLSQTGPDWDDILSTGCISIFIESTLTAEQVNLLAYDNVNTEFS